MSESLIEKVLAAKAEAEAAFSTQLANGVALDPRQEAAVLIAMVHAAMGVETEPGADDTATGTETE